MKMRFPKNENVNVQNENLIGQNEKVRILVLVICNFCMPYMGFC